MKRELDMCIVLHPQGFDAPFDDEVHQSTEGVRPELNFGNGNMRGSLFSGKKVWIPDKVQFTRFDGFQGPNESGGPLNCFRQIICLLESISTVVDWLLEEAPEMIDAVYVCRYVQT
jgi:hypothetical protein